MTTTDNNVPDDDRTDSPTDERDSPDDASTRRAGNLESQIHFDPDGGEELTTAIVRAVAEAEGVGITDLKEPLLYDHVDAAALEDSLFNNADGTGVHDHGKVQFQFHGYDVTIGSGGWIKVYESPTG